MDFAGSIYDTLFTLTTSQQVVTLVNSGNAPVVDASITVHAGTTAITNTVITLAGASMTYAGTVTAGKNLVIDVGAQSVRNDGAASYAQFTPPATQIDWFRLAPGSNSVNVATTGGGTGKTILFDYFDSWHG